MSMDRLLDGLTYTPTGMAPDGDGLPVATHEAVLEIAGHKLRVYQLSDGRRVIDADDMIAFFGGM